MIQEVAKAKTASDIVTELTLFVLVILTSTFLLRLVWNQSLVKHITVLKPIKTMMDAFVLAISLAVVRGI